VKFKINSQISAPWPHVTFKFTTEAVHLPVTHDSQPCFLYDQ